MIKKERDLKRNPQEFVNDFCSVRKKIKKKINIKKILEEEYEDRYDIRRR